METALTRAVTLVTQIERGAEPTTHLNVPTALPPHGSMRVADSLYADLERMKRNPGFACGAEELARMETELAWAGNEQVDLGHCQSSPHLAAARALANLAAQKIDGCAPPPVVARQVTTTPAPVAKLDTVATPRLDIPTVEELQIARNIHFALAQAVITPVSNEVIQGIAALLEKYPSITVRLEGHTDSRGNAGYNLDLSKRRVLAARRTFCNLGIDSTRITYDYKGKTELFAMEDSKRGFALNRRVEMVFVDSQGRDIKATRQERDLQLEADRPAPKPAPIRKGSALHKPAAGRSTARRVAPHAPGAKSTSSPSTMRDGER